MDPTPFIIFGTMMGVAATLLVQKIRSTIRNGGLTNDRTTEILVKENEQFKGKMLRLEERLSVMERITTDNHMNLTQEFERLR